MHARLYVVPVVLLCAASAAAVDVSAKLKGAGDETAAFAEVVRANRQVTVPGGFTVTISGFVEVPADTTVEGPGTIHITARYAGLRLAERCTVRDLRFTCSQAFGHGHAVIAATTQPGALRRMDARIAGCRFEKMHGSAVLADEVSHVTLESCRWENHSDSSKFYNGAWFRAVRQCIIRGNTILSPNQGILFHGGTHNIVANNYVENALQAITCHTQSGHPKHWPYTLFAHNTITGNVVRKFREEGICYDNSMGETPAVKAAQNQVRAAATIKSVENIGDSRVRVVVTEQANPGKAYGPGWADGYYAGVITGDASGTLLHVLASGGDASAGWIELPRTTASLSERLAKGDCIWLAAGCFMNTISSNSLDNDGMVSGTGNATAIGLWGAAWGNQITGNTCTSRQYGITIGCVALGKPDSPQGPSVGNTISLNTITASWATDRPRTEQKSSAGIGLVYIGDGPLLAGRLFLGNTIANNTINWTGPRPIKLARDTGTVVSCNRISDAKAAISLEHSSDVVIDGNRSMTGEPITKTEQVGTCTVREVHREK